MHKRMEQNSSGRHRSIATSHAPTTEQNKRATTDKTHSPRTLRFESQQQSRTKLTDELSGQRPLFWRPARLGWWPPASRASPFGRTDNRSTRTHNKHKKNPAKAITAQEMTKEKNNAKLQRPITNNRNMITQQTSKPFLVVFRPEESLFLWR